MNEHLHITSWLFISMDFLKQSITYLLFLASCKYNNTGKAKLGVITHQFINYKAKSVCSLFLLSHTFYCCCLLLNYLMRIQRSYDNPHQIEWWLWWDLRRVLLDLDPLSRDSKFRWMKKKTEKKKCLESLIKWLTCLWGNELFIFCLVRICICLEIYFRGERIGKGK